MKTFVASGGTLLHGPKCELARRALGIEEEPIAFDCLAWHDESEEIIPHGWSTVAFDRGEALGTYIQSGRRAIAETKFGQGRVVSFGFEYGYAYSRRSMPIVPPNYGRREMHPIVLLKETPVAGVIGRSPLAPMPPRKGVEVARFGSSLVIVNHRASPVEISEIAARHAHSQIPAATGWLAAHSTILLET